VEIIMNEKASILAEALEWALGSLERSCEALTEEEYKFKPTPVSNNIQWQLNHISRIVNAALPRLIKGVSEYTPEGWPPDYRDQDYPQDKLMSDIKKGAEVALPMLKKLSNSDLEAEIPLWGGTRQRKIGLFAYIGEVYHHKGQVTYIRGTYKRLNE
jgi:hypothetical protein